MEQLKELPEKYLVIMPDKESELLEIFKEWFINKSGRLWEFAYQYYGKTITGYWGHSGARNREFEYFTLEQWDSTVNPKKEYPVANAIHEQVKVAIESVKPIKQPKLKVGDKIPEYLNYKLSFLTKGIAAWSSQFCTHSEGENDYYVVSEHSKECYTVKHKLQECYYFLKICEVDALIEEQERELQQYENQEPTKVRPMDELTKNEVEVLNIIGYETKVWIPQNGEEVEVYDYNKWEDRHFYLGKKKNGDQKYIVENVNGIIREHAAIRKIEFIRKTHSEIAELLGISKEQLKIVEG